MEITKASLDAIFYQFDLRFKQAYDQQPIFWDQFATLSPSSSRETHYAWLAKMPRLRKWIGDRVFHNLQSRGYVITNEKYEDSLTLNRDDIEDDQIGVYTGYVDMLGQQARLWPEDLVTAALEAGTTALAFDGQPFFGTHPIDVDNPSSPTYVNLFSTATSGSTPLTAANYQKVRAAMRGYKGEDGRSLAIRPDVLMVPPLLEGTAKQILEADLIAQAVGSNAAQAQSNVFKGTARVVVNDYLTSDTAWYLMSTQRAIKPLVFQLRDAPQFTSLNSTSDPNVFLRDDFNFGVRARGAAGYSLPFLAAMGDSA